MPSRASQPVPWSTPSSSSTRVAIRPFASCRHSSFLRTLLVVPAIVATIAGASSALIACEPTASSVRPATSPADRSPRESRTY
jgi:hypothetical protein